MIRVLSGTAKPSMPPKGEPRPEASEIALIGAWIEAGAHGPQGEEPDRLALIVPKIASHTKVRPIAALDASRDGKWLAVARDADVALYKMPEQGRGVPDRPERSIGKFPGKVTAVHFTPDGTRLITASGVAGLGGMAAIWNIADGALIRQFPGHRDILYDAELSPDGDAAGHVRLRQADRGVGRLHRQALAIAGRAHGRDLRRGLQPRRPLPGERQRRRHLQGLARRRRPADGHASPAAQGGIRLHVQPGRPDDRGRGR